MQMSSRKGGESKYIKRTRHKSPRRHKADKAAKFTPRLKGDEKHNRTVKLTTDTQCRGKEISKGWSQYCSSRKLATAGCIEEKCWNCCTSPICDVHKGIPKQDPEEKGPGLKYLFDAYTGSTKALRYVAEKKVHIDYRLPIGYTALILASWRRENLECVMALVKAKASVDRAHAKKSGITALSVAVLRSNLEIAQFLIESKAAYDYSSRHAVSPLVCATIADTWHPNRQNEDKETKDSGIPGIIKYLVEECKASVNTSGAPLSGASSLIISAAAGNARVLKYFLEEGKKHDPGLDIVNFTDRRLYTPLLAAAKGKHLEVVRLLLSKGASTSARRKDGANAVFCAVESFIAYDQLPCITCLAGRRMKASAKSRKSSVRVVENSGDLICEHYNHRALKTNTCKFAQEIGALSMYDVNQLYTWSLTDASMYTLNSSSEVFDKLQEAPNPTLISKIVRALVNAKCSVNMSDDTGTTALILAAGQGMLPLVSELIQLKSDVNAVDSEGFTPLIAAVARNQTDVAKVLIDAKGEVNAKDIHNNTTLIWATRNSNHQMAQMILQAGLRDVNARDNITGMTALMNACAAMNVSLVSTLITHPLLDINITDNHRCTALTHALLKHSKDSVCIRVYVYIDTYIVLCSCVVLCMYYC
ncbi:hypothetical protein AAMO2058_000331000 [Amorphochlora amoebiformis]